MRGLQRIGALLQIAVGRPLFWVAFVAVIFGVPLVSGLSRKRPVDVPVLGALPGFQLQTASGEPITQATLRGRVWVGLFVDPACPACLARANTALALLQRHTRNLGSAFRLLAICDRPSVSEAWRHELTRAVRDPTMLWFACGEDGAKLQGAIASLLGSSGSPEKGKFADAAALVLADQRSRLRGAYPSESVEKNHLLGDITLLVNARGGN